MKRLPFHLIHPLCFGLFPAISLLAHNPRVTNSREILAPLVIIGASNILIMGIVAVAGRSLGRTALILTTGNLLFFSFGQVLNLLFVSTMDVIPQAGALSLLAVWIALFVAAAFYFGRSKTGFSTLHRVLAAAGVTAVLLPALTVSVRMIRARPFSHRWDTAVPIDLDIRPERQGHPDVYYLILDGYGREDTLRRLYGLEVEPFLDVLREKGFRVLSNARANYGITTYSLASSLNMAYLQEMLGGGVDDQNLIQHNRVMRIFHDLGYRIVTFASGYTETEIRHSDRYLGPGLALTEYQNLLIGYTPIPLLTRVMGWRTRYDLHRDRILYTLDHLAETADDPAPTFTFAHVLIPHPPFVLAGDGAPIASEVDFSLQDGLHYYAQHAKSQYIEQYAGQVLYLNRRLPAILEEIIDRSDSPPVIILQGDHGPGAGLDWSSVDKSDLEERMTIFHAWYAPPRVTGALYDDMTPVNSFRVLLSSGFDLPLSPLPDRVYFSRWGEGYDFTDITDRLANAPNSPAPGLGNRR